MRGDEKELRAIVEREGERSMWNKSYPTYSAVFKQRDGDGWSALHHAAFNGDTKCVRVLLSTEALSLHTRSAGNPDDLWNPKPASARDRCVSSLHLSAMEGHVDALRVLVPLKKRATTKANTQPIDSATHNPFSIERLAELQQTPTTSWISLPDIDGLSAFQYAVIFERIEALDHLERYALETGALPESHTSRMSSAGVAADARAIKSLEWLAAHRYPFDEVDVQDHRLLHRAVLTHDAAVVAWLLDKGGFAIDTTTAGSRRLTALHVAAQHGALAILELLMQRGCLADEWDARQSTPLHYAAGEGHLDAVEFLLARGARIDARDMNGWTALIAASGGGHTETVRALLELGAKASDSDALGNSALMHAAGRGNLDVLNLLISAGADLSACNSMGMTALHASAISGHVPVVECLVAAGAAINATDGGGFTPLDGAALSANGQATSRVLRQLGARLGRDLR
jgi:ankyrin repeat protein